MPQRPRQSTKWKACGNTAALPEARRKSLGERGLGSLGSISLDTIYPDLPFLLSPATGRCLISGLEELSLRFSTRSHSGSTGSSGGRAQRGPQVARTPEHLPTQSRSPAPFASCFTVTPPAGTSREGTAAPRGKRPCARLSSGVHSWGSNQVRVSPRPWLRSPAGHRAGGDATRGPAPFTNSPGILVGKCF